MHSHDTIPYGFCHCGCGQRTPIASETRRKKGHVKGEPCRFVLGHQHRVNRYSVDPETGCWLWQMGLDRNGYGKSMIGRVPTSAHRATWIERRGPIPDGLEVGHLCPNRHCVNPDHMHLVTKAQNTHESRVVKLTPDDVREIRRMLGTTTQRAIAERFGVSETVISRIKLGKSWSSIH